MARRGDITSLQERLTIRDLAGQGASDATIARELQRSIWTVRKWRRRGQTGTMTALATRLGRPPAGPLSTWPNALMSHILGFYPAGLENVHWWSDAADNLRYP